MHYSPPPPSTTNHDVTLTMSGKSNHFGHKIILKLSYLMSSYFALFWMFSVTEKDNHATVCEFEMYCNSLLIQTIYVFTAINRLQSLLYPQTKVGDILDSGPSRRRRRRRNFLVDAITQKRINIFFSNLVHMLRVPKGRSLF